MNSTRETRAQLEKLNGKGPWGADKPLKPLACTLTTAELRCIRDPKATEDLILSFKMEAQEAHKEAGAWQAKAAQAERLEAENARLRREIEGIKRANAELLKRVHGEMPREVQR